MMKKIRRTTLQDIANTVGITKMTVSRYLKNETLVAEPLRIKIKKAILTLGYIPNRGPNILSKGKSNAIGVLFPSISNHIFEEVLRGIESVMEPAGYQIMITHYSYSKELEEKRIASLLAFYVDALILSESCHTKNTLRMIESSGVPVIEIMDTKTQPIHQAVGFDNSMAAKEITNLLINKGYKSIAYIGAKGDLRDLLRQKGYEEAINESGFKTCVFRSPQFSSIKLGTEILDDILAVRPRIEAAICTNDDVAVGILLGCKKRGLKVPQDIAITGMHGHDIGQLFSPMLTSVVTPRFKIGEVAATQILARLNGIENFEPFIDLGYKISQGESI